MTAPHAHAHTHGAHAGHTASLFLRRFWIALALSLLIAPYSQMWADLFGVRPPLFAGWHYVVLALGSVAYFYCGGVFLMSAYREMRARTPGMMTLITLAITAAYLFSVASLLSGGMQDLLFELVSLIAIMLLGHYLEMRAVQGASGALSELSKLLPDTAEVFHGNQTALLPLSQLRAGDLVLVRPGGKVPADGVVQAGRSSVIEALVTGESKPVRKGKGASVIAGSINGDGSLTVAVSAVGERTFLGGVMRLVADAQASRSRLQLLSDRAAFYLTVIAVVLGALTLITWIAVTGDAARALERMVAVLVIACPHALGLAVPLVAAISTTKAARAGLLVRQRDALESARSIDTILLDKTGTLTAGRFGVVAATSDDVLKLAASVEAQSQHPIGAAIVEEAKRRRLRLFTIRDFHIIPGEGVSAEVGGESVFVGQRGGEDIVVERSGVRLGTIKVADTVRPEAREAVDALKRLGVTPIMVTGDAEVAAKEVADELGIEEYAARVRPEDKIRWVSRLQREGKKVAMVGDGVNDAPALAQADVGIAVGAGTNVAIESAGIILVRSDPRDVLKILTLSGLTYDKMIQNLWWAAGYNVVALPLAAGALAPWGIVLSPAVAAVLMTASTVIVAFNALLLRRAAL
jgi:Cu2+-exporting ATPase